MTGTSLVSTLIKYGKEIEQVLVHKICVVNITSHTLTSKNGKPFIVHFKAMDSPLVKRIQLSCHYLILGPRI